MVYKSGHGLNAKWDEACRGSILIPQFLMQKKVSDLKGVSNKPRVGFRPIARTTDTRTIISSVVPGWPSGNSMITLTPKDWRFAPALAAVFGSLVSDAVLRLKQSSSNLNWFILAEHPIPSLQMAETINKFAISLAATSPSLSCWFSNKSLIAPAYTDHERLRVRCILEALCAKFLGLQFADFKYLLAGVDYPSSKLQDEHFSKLLNSKGFWRVDKDKDPELRHTVLSLIAFHDLQEKGLDAFVAQNNAEGWMIPEQLRLADYGLGHDERARECQPVASRLGPRFYDWQLNEDVVRSWQECTAHAELIRRIVPPPEPEQDSGVAEEPATYKKNSPQGALF